MKLSMHLRALVTVLSAVLIVLSTSATTIRAQEGLAVALSSGSASTLAQEIDTGAPSEVTPAATSDELLPISMRPYYHVFAAFGLAWLLIFGYAVSLRRRVVALEKEVEQLSR